MDSNARLPIVLRDSIRMTENRMPATLNSILEAIRADKGLHASIPMTHIRRGVEAAQDMNAVLMKVMAATGVNDDGQVNDLDMKAISEGTFRNAENWQDFILGHGNDAGRTTGFHWVQNDGGTLLFQGRNAIDTVIDAIYHFGFQIKNGRYYNEDGNDNETAVDVAGWLNFFLNGVNIVYGSGGKDELGSGTYSNYFAKARSETFLAGDGNDKVWADVGNDKVYGGSGNDMSGGGRGNDRMFGEAGSDTLYGEGGRDQMSGGFGDDLLGGGDKGDILDGGGDADTLYGDGGADRLIGGDGWDELSGGDANDRLFGGSGGDKLYSGDGSDLLNGGAGADQFYLWENRKARDTLVFQAGDSGMSGSEIDRVEGFETGRDKIDLSSLGPMVFRASGDYAGGTGSCYYIENGENSRLMIDANGDKDTDMVIGFRWTELHAGDFIFA
jgi:Ca2+-binding RTX toxin-like protein